MRTLILSFLLVLVVGAAGAADWQERAVSVNCRECGRSFKSPNKAVFDACFLCSIASATKITLRQDKLEDGKYGLMPFESAFVGTVQQWYDATSADWVLIEMMKMYYAAMRFYYEETEKSK